MSDQQNFEHWQVTKDSNQVLWVVFNRKDKALNALNKIALDEFEQILDNAHQDSSVRAMVIKSAKENGFIAGVDLDFFASLTDVNEAVQTVRKGQFVFDKLAKLSVPTIAMIEGFCLGGGLELALACRYRIALDDPKTQLGLPEIKLGIHPGWGGTVRLPQLIGPIKAFDLILSGRSVSAKTAAQMGFVDAAVPLRQMQNAVNYYLTNLPKPREATVWEHACDWILMRHLLAWQMRRKVAAKAKSEHYPAPYAVIDNWLSCGVFGNRAMALEASSIGKLFASDTSKNLLRVFFLQEQLKSLGKTENFVPEHVHVIGAGVMGGDIAAWCALQGLTVTLQDRKPELIAPAIKRAYELYKKKLKTPRAIQAAMDRLFPDVEGSGIKNADVIIEAIYEDLNAKQALFKEIEEKAKPDAILATNTSTIPLDEISAVLKDKSRLVGIHFFNPVSMMPLVEVVQGEGSDSLLIAKSMAFVRQIERLPLPVKSSPGFLVNRILMPYLMECAILIGEGVPYTVIDQAATDFGMPVGPVELLDTVGLDVCLSAAKNLAAHLGGEVPPILNKMVAEGRLGRKVGKGFYYYKNGAPVKPKAPKGYTANRDLIDRLIFPMLNESAACLREGVVTSSDLVDAGMIFGTGFAPFRGGPMHYAEKLGITTVLNTLQTLASQYGPRFQPDPYWGVPPTQQLVEVKE